MAVDISKLNKQQAAAVTHGDGPVLLIAGAGTGKTTVVTNRIAWLIANGRAKPDEILAVTFTDKAAAEMEERVDQLLPLGYTDLWIHTFHAFCQRILTDHAIDIGVPNSFRLLDTTSAWMLVHDNFQKFELDYYKPLGNPTKFIHALLTHFSRCKDEGISPEEYLQYAEKLKLDTDQMGDRDAADEESARVLELANAYHTYQQLLLEKNVLDFGDLINYTLKLFRSRKKILQQYRAQFKYIVVDEFQDTNYAQYELIKLLAAPANNVMVVGDDDQSIYKFRGASFSNILKFKQEYPDATEMYLTDNYRSGQKILDKAYEFIQLNNPDRLEVKLGGLGALNKKLKSHLPLEGLVSVLHYKTADDEVRGVIEKIMELKNADPDLNWHDIAILVRANEQAQRFVRYFRSMQLPHQFVASRGLYSQDIIIAIMSYLKLLDNYHESEALYKILSLPIFAFDAEDLIHLNHLASQKSWSLWHTINNCVGQIELKKQTVDALQKFLALIARHTQLAREIDPSVLIYRFLEDSGYLTILTLEDSTETREQLLFLNQFYKKVRTWEEEHLGGRVKEFIDAINLELESGDAGHLEQDIEAGPDQITISTVHGAKGLEYRYVFIANVVHLRFPTRERKDPIELPEALVKDILPSGDAHLQEERRLMYVALTRAKEAAYLTYADDYGNATLKKPSVFLAELGLDTTSGPLPVNQELVLPEVHEQKIPQYTLPHKFSFTQLRAFETCPKQYYYAHIIRIPSAGKAVFSFGKVLHAVLEKFFTVVKERAASEQGSLFGKMDTKQKPVSEKELLDIYEQLWTEDWFYDEENKKKYKERGLAILKKFYDNLGGSFPTPVALEQPFNVKIKKVTLRGVIDRIDEMGDGTEKQWKIIDYKTGKGPKDDKLSFKDKEQLLMYQIAANEVFGKQVGALVLYYLEPNKQFEFLGSEKELEKIRNAILETVEAIKTSDFAPTPGFWCGSCDYRYICPAAQR